MTKHLEENAIRFASFEVAFDGRPGRLLGLITDTGQGQRPAVEHAGVQGTVEQNDGMVWRHLVKVTAGGVTLFSQIKIVISACYNPVSAPRLLNVLIYSRFDVLDGFHCRRTDIKAQKLPQK